MQPGAKIIFVSQEPEITGDTLLDYCTAGGAEDYEAQATLADFGLDPEKGTQGLSGGEKRRAALARAFAEQPDVLLLDEPTNHLDIFAIQTLEEELASSKCAALIVSHDRAFLNRVTQRTFWLEHRKVRRLDKGFGEFEIWSEQVLAAEADEERRLNKVLERENAWLARGVQGRRARNEGRRRALMDLRSQKKDLQGDKRGSMYMAIENRRDVGQEGHRGQAPDQEVRRPRDRRGLLDPHPARRPRGAGGSQRRRQDHARAPASGRTGARRRHGASSAPIWRSPTSTRAAWRCRTRSPCGTS
jgi:ATP-binding cassette subfamily F protein uup